MSGTSGCCPGHALGLMLDGSGCRTLAWFSSPKRIGCKEFSKVHVGGANSTLQWNALKAFQHELPTFGTGWCASRWAWLHLFGQVGCGSDAKLLVQPPQAWVTIAPRTCNFSLRFPTGVLPPVLQTPWTNWCPTTRHGDPTPWSTQDANTHGLWFGLGFKPTAALHPTNEVMRVGFNLELGCEHTYRDGHTC